MSDGTSKTVMPVWSSDAPSVATVNGGLLVGLLAGEATIIADYEGRRATRKIRVIPDFGGSWTGGYRITSCTDSGVLDGICDVEDTSGVYRVDLVFTQNNAALTGSVQPFADLVIPVTGSLAIDGLLTLSGSAVQTSDGVVIKGDIVDWSARLPSATQMMTGRFTVVMTIPNRPGDWTMQCEIVEMFRTAAQLQSSGAFKGHGWLAPRILKSAQ